MTHLAEFTAHLVFPLDDFQREACAAVESGQGVLVCAPTGSGKTIVGEFAVSLALSQHTTCFYTTPIKALSNQKYHDLVRSYGPERVGLLTGDQSINRDAPIVVMTTEVLRNMIYADSSALRLLSHVVMDEIHFLADASRGAVWEEVILGLDESVRIIGLSATVSNSEEFGHWLGTVRGDTRVIVSEHRPVPLHQWMMVGTKAHSLFDPQDPQRVSPALLQHIGRFQDSRFRPPARPEVIAALRHRDMLPAITFIFSRAGCDAALFQCLRSKLTLTTEEEARQIRESIDAAVADIPAEDLEVLRFRQWRAALMRGFAAHHAGMLPAFRHIVEDLFTRGLVRAVFATETLALGINMPARTVVLERLVKFNGEAHVDLTPAQYTQLTGRAGRRGIDVVGHAVVQWSPDLDPRAVAGLAATRTYPLVSTFQPGYNMSVNLLGRDGYDHAVELLEMSFAQFQADASVVDEARTLERTRSRLRTQEEELAQGFSTLAPPGTPEDLLDYIALRQRLSAEEKRHRTQAVQQRDKEITRILATATRGEVLALPGKKRPVIAVVVEPARSARDPRPLVVSQNGWTGRVEARTLGNAPVRLGHMRIPGHHRKNSRIIVRNLHRFTGPAKLKTKARLRPSKEVARLREQVRAHPVHQWPPGDREYLARFAENILRTREQERRQEAAATNSDTLAHTFRRILDLLTEMDYVAPGYTLTEEGERLARIHSASDLLIAQCLRRGIWDDLDPAELAGVVSLCVFENRKTTQGEVTAATEPMAAAMSATERVWSELVHDEQRHRLPLTPAPEGAFALAMHQWTAGAPLGYCLAAAAQCGAELTAGDFVRWCRQVVDLLEQVALTAYQDLTRAQARRAAQAIRRGVVAVGI
ncbi:MULTISPECIES: DEAD/DEAH box helicase [unclassified Corynebacterium]|uniref:DEAD/DEAH box helicase n=1 Tax=unclassified Corynebacterium TaxID=2624378 RepID=UPI0029CA740A|nr:MULTISPECIES: DEAD/DEAH box helicase [unclassified Corynebacterium]WPF67184.1 DEAD/DEAH box helicase [Corynebacterium sp. 22KM0430]WPF69673.1 DEAD/DEAH box helicase [Corynebacterium sp. 21KM1197]